MRPHSPAGVFASRIKIVVLAVLSLGAGVTLVSAFAPVAFLGLSTAELALILGLLALPLLTLAGLASDRGALGGGAEAPGDSGGTAIEGTSRTGVHGTAHLPRLQMHGPGRRHPPTPRGAEHRAHERS